MEPVIPMDMLDDLCSRFIINVPEEEKLNLVRLCFQIELAHWFYIDFYSKKKDNRKIAGFKEFAAIVFRHVPFLHPHAERIDQIIDEFKEYKYYVPTYGAILLSEDLSHVLLAQSFCSKSSWGFPKGKINKGESPWQCAIREVLEETGFDIRKHMDPTEYVEAVINDSTVRLYIVTGISMDEKFEPKTRNEIKSLRWFPLAELPATKKEAVTKLKTMSGTVSLFMVTPFVRKLREWIYDHGRTPKKTRRPRNKSCGDLDFLELKDCLNATPDKKKLGKKAEVFEEADESNVPARPNSAILQPKNLDRMNVSGRQSMTSEAEVKVRRTLEYVMKQNPKIGSPINLDEKNKNTPNQKIRILKKPDRPVSVSGKELLTSLFSNMELTSGDAPNPQPTTARALEEQITGQDSTRKLESPQSKSLGSIHHDKTLSSFARVAHKPGGRNYFLSHPPGVDSKATTPTPKTPLTPENKSIPFIEIGFSKNFSRNGAKAWSNFKFDRQAIVRRMNG